MCGVVKGGFKEDMKWREWLGVGGSECGEESDSHSALVHTHTPPPLCVGACVVVVGSVRAASEPTSCLPPRCRHPTATLPPPYGRPCGRPACPALVF